MIQADLPFALLKSELAYPTQFFNKN